MDVVVKAAVVAAAVGAVVVDVVAAYAFVAAAVVTVTVHAVEGLLDAVDPVDQLLPASLPVLLGQ